MPFFSIVIPSYNRAEYLHLTIESIQDQLFQDWECVIIDDGSTDNSAEIVQEIIQNDARIKYIYQENAERSVARNNGIKNSSGEYICFLDSDDLYKENHLQVLFENIHISENKISLFFVNQTILIENREEKCSTITYYSSADYFIENSIIPVRVCIHRDIFKSYSFDQRIVIVEDAVLWTQIARHFPIFHIEVDTVIYRWHDDNSVNIKNNCFLPRLKGLYILFESKEMRQYISRKMRNKAIGNCYYGIAKHYSYKQNFIKMCIFIFRSILKDLKCKQNKAKIYMIYEYFR